MGIIGVVAALTLPSFIYNHRKQVVESRLKKFYTTFSQAIILSQQDNGELESWEDLDLSSITASEEWYNKYFAKYLNTVSVERNGNASDYVVWVNFADGSALGIRYTAPTIATSFNMYFFPYAGDVTKCTDSSGSRRVCCGSKSFTFHFDKKGLKPYGALAIIGILF